MLLSNILEARKDTKNTLSLTILKYPIGLVFNKEMLIRNNWVGAWLLEACDCCGLWVAIVVD